jgi:hypothetical protein
MQTIYFSVQSFCIVKLSSSEPFICGDREKLLLACRIPGIVFLDDVPDQVSITVEHLEQAPCACVEMGGKMILFDTWNGVIPEDVYHLLYAMVRVHLLGQLLFPLHAACVGKDGRFTLLIGHTGVGKTTCTLKLLAHESMKLFSGDKTIVQFTEGGLAAVAGTETLTVRGRDTDAVTLSPFLPYTLSGTRLAFQLEPEKYVAQRMVPISSIALVRLNDYAPEVKREEEASALHTLYPYFLDVIHADTVLHAGSSIFLGTPPQGTQAYLVQQLRDIFATVPVYSVTGSSDYIANQIALL